MTKSYVEQLEKQNEELRKKVAHYEESFDLIAGSEKLFVLYFSIRSVVTKNREFQVSYDNNDNKFFSGWSDLKDNIKELCDTSVCGAGAGRLREIIEDMVEDIPDRFPTPKGKIRDVSELRTGAKLELIITWADLG